MFTRIIFFNKIKMHTHESTDKLFASMILIKNFNRKSGFRYFPWNSNTDKSQLDISLRLNLFNDSSNEVTSYQTHSVPVSEYIKNLNFSQSVSIIFVVDHPTRNAYKYIHLQRKTHFYYGIQIRHY